MCEPKWTDINISENWIEVNRSTSVHPKDLAYNIFECVEIHWQSIIQELKQNNSHIRCYQRATLIEASWNDIQNCKVREKNIPRFSFLRSSKHRIKNKTEMKFKLICYKNNTSNNYYSVLDRSKDFKLWSKFVINNLFGFSPQFVEELLLLIGQMSTLLPLLLQLLSTRKQLRTTKPQNGFNKYKEKRLERNTKNSPWWCRSNSIPPQMITAQASSICGPFEASIP